MRARKPSSQKRAKLAPIACVALLAQLGCADDAAPPSEMRPDVPAPTLDTSVARRLDAAVPDAAIEGGAMDARAPLLDAMLDEAAVEADAGLDDARTAASDP